MRISELCSLNRSQIDDSGRIFITGKGRKQRFVYLTLRARQHLDAYLATRDRSCPVLFIPYAGRNAAKSANRISTNYLQDRIKRYREKLRINVATSAHSLLKRLIANITHWPSQLEIRYSEHYVNQDCVSLLASNQISHS